MFKALVNQWRAARGTVLRQQVEDFAKRAAALPEPVSVRLVSTIAETFGSVLGQAGSVKNLSDQGRIQLGKELQARARDRFHTDMLLVGGPLGEHLELRLSSPAPCPTAARVSRPGTPLRGTFGQFRFRLPARRASHG
jgi:hypothetical protein